ncbi:hypothetical protein IQ244_26140 [Nostoc sp. LEGE 06077]|uniref:hypothetical protein n=1 Tax=Nostoc sp. LEGE 06077 TaxID=915325 RepID=UPI00187EB1EC|nr:hypothetical protein [Nostoc sp. LEGE 06077]MBE9209912.1 hypothetical protein [Nostoc sp. LEGE 06077]
MYASNAAIAGCSCGLDFKALQITAVVPSSPKVKPMLECRAAQWLMMVSSKKLN